MLFYAAPSRAISGISPSILLIQKIFYEKLVNQFRHLHVCFLKIKKLFIVEIKLQVVHVFTN